MTSLLISDICFAWLGFPIQIHISDQVFSYIRYATFTTVWWTVGCCIEFIESSDMKARMFLFFALQTYDGVRTAKLNWREGSCDWSSLSLSFTGHLATWPWLSHRLQYFFQFLKGNLWCLENLTSTTKLNFCIMYDTNVVHNIHNDPLLLQRTSLSFIRRSLAKRIPVQSL